MKNNFSPLLLLLVAGLFFASACSKPFDFGLSVLSDDALFGERIDSVTIRTKTERIDSLLTSGLGRNFFIGTNNDPVFGQTNAAVYVTFGIPTVNLDFTGSSVDSIILSIAYDSIGHYGDLSQVQTWEVHRLSEELDYTEVYYSNNTLATSDVLNSGYSFRPAPTTDVRVQVVTEDTSYVDTIAPQIRIPLSLAFGAELLNPSDTTVYDNNDNFKEFFKGVLIKPSGNANSALLRMLLNNSQSKITLYYHQDGKPKTYTYKIDAQLLCTAFGAYTHDYTGTSVLDNNPADTIAYLQGLGGTRVTVEFPYLQNLSNLIVNYAELTFYLAKSDDPDLFPEPESVILSYINNSGDEVNLVEANTSYDRFSNFTTFFGGKKEQVTINGTQYVLYSMNVSRHVQQLMKGAIEDERLFLRVSFGSEFANRAQLGNENSQIFAPKLQLTYTKIQ